MVLLKQNYLSIKITDKWNSGKHIWFCYFFPCRWSLDWIVTVSKELWNMTRNHYQIQGRQLSPAVISENTVSNTHVPFRNWRKNREKAPHLENARSMQMWNVSSWWNHLPLKFRVDWLKREHTASSQIEPRDNERQHWATAADFQGCTGISKEDGKKGSTVHKRLIGRWKLSISY